MRNCYSSAYTFSRLDSLGVYYSTFEVDDQRRSDGTLIDEVESRNYIKLAGGTVSVPQLWKNGVYLGSNNFVDGLSDAALHIMLGN